MTFSLWLPWEWQTLLDPSSNQTPLSCFPHLAVVQLLSRVCLFVTPWTSAHQASLSFTISWSLLKLMSVESVMLSNHLILCCPFLLPPSIFPSIRVFSNESVLHIRWPKFWSFSISPSNEYSGLISFKIDWFDLLKVNHSSIFQKESLEWIYQNPVCFWTPILVPHSSF